MKLSIVQSVRMLSVTKSPKSDIVLNVVMLSVVAKLSQLCSSMGNVRQVILLPNAFVRIYFIFMYLFYPTSPLK
jgi:hypothetical protein